ncbi:hypothetical protein GCM10008904_31010 [Paraclostridium ghonii]|uniref:DnaD/phage-associated family protein n=1 Tax=Paraclostridium ghonii TaxID=29358 RepID=A0ABU0MX61_9FIRM|nr:DnaD domain protein [Paeniclostridium ghonii]MDQ0555498.1 DnaD/phage-associated family protein [Paeniclostridium ghonii]
MEYTIHGFSQENAIKLGLDDRDLLILRWFVRFKDNGKMTSKIIDGDKYYWIKYEGIIEDLPITNIKSNDSVYRRLKKMSKVKVLKHKTIKAGGTYSYYCLGENYSSLVDTDKKLSDINPNPSDLKSDGTDLNPDQKTLIPYHNTNTINNMYLGKEELIKEFSKLYQSNIGVINGLVAEQLIGWSQLIEVGLFKRAIEICTERGNLNLGYLKGIIKKWLNSHITTLEELEAQRIQNSIKSKCNKSITNFNKNNSEITLNPKVHNFNGSDNFMKYSPEELEKILLQNSKNKFK